MISVGFIESDKKFTALEIFNQICNLGKLDIVSYNISKTDLSNNYYQTQKLNVLVLDNSDYLKDKNVNDFLKNNVNEKGIIILNIDDKNNIKLIKGLNSVFITYGFDTKSSVTASSVQEIEYFDEIQYCIQRTIPTLLGDKIEQQEFRTIINHFRFADTCKILAAISAALICGLQIKNFENIIL